METDVPTQVSTTCPRKDKQPAQSKRTRRQPRYEVVLWNDEDHTFHYVVRMLSELFGYPNPQGWQLANEVHYRGRVVLLTTSREHAELKRDQIHSFGRDAGVRRCRGSMSATIEPLT